MGRYNRIESETKDVKARKSFCRHRHRCAVKRIKQRRHIEGLYLPRYAKSLGLGNGETFFGRLYTDLKTNGIHQRVFNFDVEDKELIWHRDKLDRKIKVVSGVNWKLQMDNELQKY